MKKINLFLYNYGRYTRIANFYNSAPDAVKCLRALNDSQIKAHGYLPNSIFYFLTYSSSINKKTFWVDYTGNKDNISNIYPVDLKQTETILKPKTSVIK